MKNLRKAWMQAEEMGASRLYVADHFNAQRMDTNNVTGGQITAAVPSQNFEATTVQAAMAATTTRPEIGLRIVAEHADIWHVFGPLDKIREKKARLRELCREVGRDPAEIEIIANCMRPYIADNDPDIMYRELGIKHIIGLTEGPKWDMGQLRELIQWRDALKD